MGQGISLKSERNNPWFKPWFNILLHTQSNVRATVFIQWLEYLGYITLVQTLARHALEIWIFGCTLFYKRYLWASKPAGSHNTISLKISGCKRCCPNNLWVCAPAAPVPTHSLFSTIWYTNINWISTRKENYQKKYLCEWKYLIGLITFTCPENSTTLPLNSVSYYLVVQLLS